jgi:hypothetical protein
MSKIIKLTDSMIEDLCKDFRDSLTSSKMSDGKVTYTKSFQNYDEKATLYFTETAWIKMATLVSEFDKEVAWHGVAKRGDDKSKNEYIVSDIMVYPQEVTGSTVNTDQTKYQNWLYSFDDNTFNNIRFQGHSHVNMGTTPSAVDLTHQNSILEQLNDDMFYIFIIINKKHDKTIKIYDLAKNMLFETKDVTIQFIDDGLGLREFISEAKSMVTEKTYSYKSYNNYGNNYYGYGTREYDNFPSYHYSYEDEPDDTTDSVLIPYSSKNSVKNKKKGKRKRSKELRK